MINQYIFLLFITLLGYSFLFLTKDKLSPMNHFFLSLPTGLSIWLLLLMILFLFNLPFNKFIVYFLSLCLLLFFILKSRKRLFSKQEIKPKIIFFTLFSALIWVFLFFNYSFFTNDSWRLLVGGKYVVAASYLSESLVDKGGIFSYLIQSSSSIFKFDYLYALYPLLTLFLLLFCFNNLNFPFKKKGANPNKIFLLIFISVLFILSTLFLLFNAFYIHSNLPFGIYTFIALFGLWKRLITENKSWLFISALATLTSIFLRLEGSALALIIIVILLSIEEIEVKEKLHCFGPVFLFVIAWHIKLAFLLSGQNNEYILNTQRVLFIAVIYSLVFITLWISEKRLLRKIKKYLPLMMLYFLSIGWCFFLFTRGLKTESQILIVERYGIFLLNILKKGGWGITWMALVLFFLAALFLKRIKHESIFLYYIFSFGLLYNPIHIYRGGWREGWGDSGNRMLLSIIFVTFFYTFLKFRQGFAASFEKNG